MKRKTINLAIVLTLIAFFLFGVKYETIIYLGMSSSTSDGYSIDAQVKIDGELITKDSINNNPYKYKTIKKKLGIGFRKVEILSVKAGVYSTMSLFILPNQYILMEFDPRLRSIGEEPEFDIVNRFNPFRYE